ncbi:MAG: BamA/TamA family outer membrane protein [Candidatus Cloacimonetes bacterium]|nr:BamA/TamA family outer membrane protein [Candidatus Cloacimonadota bacterium]
MNFRLKYIPLAALLVAQLFNTNSHALELSSGLSAPAPQAKAPQYRITDIDVRGNQNTAKQIIMLSIGSKVGDFITKDQVIKDVTTIYKLGYFQAPPQPQTEKHGSGVRLVFYVSENPQVSTIKVEGNTLIPTENILEDISTKVGSVLNIRQLYEDLALISKLYKDKGYIYSGIYDPTKQVKIDGTDIVLKIKESRINSINIKGNRKTKKYVIMRELLMEEGQIIKQQNLVDSFRNLRNLDYFEIENPDIAVNPESGDVNITLNLKDTKTGTASFGGGYSSLNGFVGFVDATERNFRGKGQTLRVKTQFGGEQAYELAFTEPYWKGKKQAIGASVFRTIVDRDDIRNQTLLSRFEEKRDGYSLFTSWRKKKDESLTLRFVDERISTRVLAGTPTALFDDHQQTIGLSWIRDKRDNFQNATDGYRHSVSFSTTGGIIAGTNNFNKYSYDFRKYWPTKIFANDQVVAFRTKLALAQKIDGFIPYIDLWSIGGSQTLRGYEDREFVGKKMWFTNLELRHPISKQFSAALFVDAGSAWGEYNSFEMKKAYGLGIRFKTPLGPFRLDWAKATDRSSAQIHFGIGNTF